MRTYVLDKIDKDGDGKLSQDEAADVKVMVLGDVMQLSGLDVFPNLATVVAGGPGLTSVDINGVPSLSRLDLSGAANLSSLTIENALDLKNVDIRGTGLASVDFSRAGHLERVLANPSTTITGLEDASVVQRVLPTHFEGLNTGNAAYSTSDFEVDAQYDDEGRLDNRTISGSLEAHVEYTYGDNGLPLSVDVDSDREGVGRSWTIEYGEDYILATASDGATVNRSYDSKGRLSSVALDITGTDEAIQGEITLSYDARGFLSGAMVQTGDGQLHYEIGSNGAGQVETISAADGAATFYGYSGSTYSVLGQIDQEGASVGRVTSDGRYFGGLSTDEDGASARTVGEFGTYTQEDAEEGSRHDWGKLASSDGSVQYRYDVDYEAFELPANVATTTSAVDLTDKANPSPYVDYWLMDDIDTALQLAIREASQFVWSMGSTDPIVPEVYDEDILEQYEDALPGIAAELGVKVSQLQYSLVNLGYSSKPQLVVTDDDHADSLLAIYSFVGDSVEAVASSDEGSTMVLCGDGFVRTIDAEGNQTVSFFTGIAFDDVAYVRDGVYHNLYLGVHQADDGSGNTALESAYPSAMASISWVG